jgi:hypothetical protein
MHKRGENTTVYNSVAEAVAAAEHNNTKITFNIN